MPRFNIDDEKDTLVAPYEQIEIFLDKNLPKKMAADAKKQLNNCDGEFIPVVIADTIVRIERDGKFVYKNPQVFFLDIASDDDGDIPYAIAKTIRQTIKIAREANDCIVGSAFAGGRKPAFNVAVIGGFMRHYVGRVCLPEYRKILREEARKQNEK